jgi:hypothetical protein
MNVKSEAMQMSVCNSLEAGSILQCRKQGSGRKIVDGLAAQASSRDRRPEVSHSRPHGRKAFVAAAGCAGVARCVVRVVNYCIANMPGAVPRTSTFALNNRVKTTASMMMKIIRYCSGNGLERSGDGAHISHLNVAWTFSQRGCSDDTATRAQAH